MHGSTSAVEAVVHDPNYTMYFDGGASPNPGHMLSRGGAGCKGANALLRDLNVSKRENNEDASERMVKVVS